MSVLAVGLLALLAVVAALQYRWTGELSEAELRKLREGGQGRAAGFTRAFDREITRAFVTFGVNPGRAREGDWNDIVRSYEQWRSLAQTRLKPLSFVL